MKQFIKISLVAAVTMVALVSCLSFDLVPTTASSGSRDASSGSRDAGTIRVDNNETVRLDAGTWTGTLRVEANHATVTGAGVGRTVLRGNLVVDGNANTVRGLTVLGTVTISGNTNDLGGADLGDADVSASGNNNRY